MVRRSSASEGRKKRTGDQHGDPGTDPASLGTVLAEFDRLSALDAVFLGIESERNPMHIGLTAVFEKGPLRTPSGALDADKIKRYVRTVLAALPRFRRRLARVPLLRRPVLVDDARFDLDLHLRFLTLARGDDAELRALVERIYSERLDRQRPLWELWVIDGLSGDRFVIVTKAHHCLVDGVSGIAALTSMLRPTPETSFDEPPVPVVPSPPTGRELLMAELRRIARPVRPRAADVRGAARDLAAGLAHAVSSVFPRAGRTSLRPSLPLARRSVAWLELALRDVKAVKDSSSAKMNDVVLAVVSGALSRLVARGGGPAHGPFRALVPVSLHAATDVSFGNEVSLVLVSLPVSEPDPRTALRLVTERMNAEKASGEVEAIATAEDFADVWFFGLVTATARLALAFRPYNVIVTNIRGPEFPLYLLGGKLLSVFPLVPLYGKDTLGLAILSYDDKLCWGVSGDVAGDGDLTLLAEDLRGSFGALRESTLAAAATDGG